MDPMNQFLATIVDTENREKIAEIIECVQNSFPELILEIKWKQPMFTHHGTYIIAFSVAKAHFSFSPEKVGIEIFKEEAKSIGYQTTPMLIKIKRSDDINYDFIEKVIQFNIKDKKECKSFWR